jgi:hypothetical protein
MWQARIACLKHAFNQSDEELVDRRPENVV